MRTKHIFTQIQIDQITELFHSGMGARKIAITTNSTIRSIKTLLTSLKLKHPKGYVNPPISKSNNIVTDNDTILKIKELFDLGYGYSKTAKTLGCEIATIRNTFEVLGLHHNKGHRNPLIKDISNELQICTACNLEKNKSNFTFREKNISDDQASKCHSCRKSNKMKMRRKETNIQNGKLATLKNDEPLTEGELNKIKTLFNQNTTRRKIANELNITIHRVKKAYKQLGLIGTNKVGRYGYVSKAEVSKKTKERRKIDPIFRLRHSVSVMIYNALKRNKSSKSGRSIVEFLLYSINDLIAHLEKQFEPWMNWQNQGKYRLNEWNDDDPSTWKWQIDHIIPHSTFNYETMDCEEFRNCWALSNLRPLSAKQNIIDGVREI